MERNYESMRVIPHYILCGPHNPLFFKYANLIKVAIEKLKLTPMATTIEKSAVTADFELLPPWWKYGGMKVAHLHYLDHVYMLDHKQWQWFSKNLLESFSETVREANAVSFDNALGISDMLESAV